MAVRIRPGEGSQAHTQPGVGGQDCGDRGGLGQGGLDWWGLWSGRAGDVILWTGDVILWTGWGRR